MALISVIIPVYNREKELIRAITSVLIQSIQDFEILVVDDCSEVDLYQVVNSFNNIRIKYFRLEKKGNANVCRNIGLKEAKGQYIAMLDSDDEWLPRHLEMKSKFLEENNCDGVFGSYQIDDGDCIKPIISRDFYCNENMTNYIMSGGKSATPTHFYKAKCAKEIEWDVKLFRHQDYDYSIRFSEKFIFLPSKDITCVVHWKKKEQRFEHFDSQMMFINKHRNKISFHNYHSYHKGIYNCIKNRKDIHPKIITHYFREQTKFIHAMSFIEYMGIVNAQSIWSRICYRLVYVLRVMFKY